MCTWGPWFQPLAPGRGCEGSAVSLRPGFLPTRPPGRRLGPAHRSYWDNGPDTESSGYGAQDRRGLHGGISGVGFSLGLLPRACTGAWLTSPGSDAMYLTGRRPPRPPDLSNDAPPRTRDPDAAYPFIPHWGPQEFFTIQ